MHAGDDSVMVVAVVVVVVMVGVVVVIVALVVMVVLWVGEDDVDHNNHPLHFRRLRSDLPKLYCGNSV